MTTATTKAKVTTMAMDPRGLPGGLIDGVGARWLGVVGGGGHTQGGLVKFADNEAAAQYRCPSY